MNYRILEITALLSIGLTAGSFMHSAPEPGWNHQLLVNDSYSKFVEVEAYDGKVGVAYVDSLENGLRLAEKDISGNFFSLNNSNRWEKQVIDDRSKTGMYVSLKTFEEEPYVAYQQTGIGDEKLYYAERSEGSWIKTEVDNVGEGGVAVGRYASLSFLEENPVIFYHSPSQGLKMAEKEDDWNKQILEPNQGWYMETERCEDRVMVAYRGRDSPRVKLAEYDGDWQSSNTSIRARADLDIAAEDCNIHSAYLDTSSNRITYRSPEKETKTFTDAFFARVALDYDQQPHAVYHDSGVGVVYVTREDGEWSNRTLRKGSDLGRYNDVEVDELGNIHAVYTADNQVYYSSYNSGSIEKIENNLDWVRTGLSTVTLILVFSAARKLELIKKTVDALRGLRT